MREHLLKKYLFLFLYSFFLCASAQAAVTIKKAEAVQEQKSSGGSATDFLGTAINLGTGIIAMNKDMKAVSAECYPTAPDITFIENTMKEYAKTGAQDKSGIYGRLSPRTQCVTSNGYGAYVAEYGKTAGARPCFNFFSGSGDKDMVWDGYPRVGTGVICPKGGTDCEARDQEKITDAYEIFNLIEFGPGDYKTGELTQATKLLEKVEVCSDAKISEKKRQMWMGMLNTTISNIGAKQSSGDVMQTVQSVVGGGGGVNSLGGVASMIPGIFGK
ncbi:MAG: hypothetical protein LBO08_00685 [Rickettsiales bacterium]|nr:hypothetical protein [Rickettsiales bacterium]